MQLQSFQCRQDVTDDLKLWVGTQTHTHTGRHTHTPIYKIDSILRAELSCPFSCATITSPLLPISVSLSDFFFLCFLALSVDKLRWLSFSSSILKLSRFFCYLSFFRLPSIFSFPFSFYFVLSLFICNQQTLQGNKLVIFMMKPSQFRCFLSRRLIKKTLILTGVPM